METLQLAQMLADLSDLNAADPRAANALVSANKATARQAHDAPPPTSAPSTADTATSGGATPIPSSSHKRVNSASALGGGGPSSPISRTNSHTGTSTPFDAYFGRRLLTPPISRTTSNSSAPGTPGAEDDVDRAASLIALYELRAKLKQYNDSNSLRQARDKVAALSARQQQAGQQQPPTSAPSSASANASLSTSPTQAPPTNRRHSQYTYPRS